MSRSNPDEVRIVARAVCPFAKVCPWTGVARVCVYCLRKMFYEKGIDSFNAGAYR